MSNQLLNIVNSISCFQLAVFSFFLLHKGRKKLPNLILALFFIAQFIAIGIFLVSNIFLVDGYRDVGIVLAGVPFWFLFGPLMFFYIRSLVKKDFSFHLIDLIHLVPFIIGVVFIFSNFYLFNYEAQMKVINSGLIFQQIFYFIILMNLQVIIYNAFSLFILFSYQKNLKNYCSSFEKKNLVWLKIVLFGYLVPCLINEISCFARDVIPVSYDNQNLFVYSSFLIFFNILYYKAMLHPYVIVQSREKSKYAASNLGTQDIISFSKKIEEYVRTKKPYLNPTLTIGELSESLGISEKYISQVLNQYWNQNFYNYINALRVEEAKKLLKTQEIEKSTMFGIAMDSGFNSKTVFYEAFKKHVGMTPSDYRKQNVNSVH